MLLHLHSEYNKLKAVITHRPSKEIERITPYNAKELLFEDVPYLEVMQKEHDNFVFLIRQATQATVYKLDDLLAEIMLNKKLAKKILEKLFVDKKNIRLVDDILERYSTAECVSIAIAGLQAKELNKKLKTSLLDRVDQHQYLVLPNPNFYFMRDPAAITQQGVICSKMKYKSRQSEAYIVEQIFKHHSIFKESFNKIFPLDEKNKSTQEHNESIEGGDVVILSKKAIAIGATERTTPEAVRKIALQVLKQAEMEKVYQVNLPQKRNFMHLDTVFTIIDENLIITYPDALKSILSTTIYIKEGIDAQGEVIMRKEVNKLSFIDVLKQEIPYLEIIETGAGIPDFTAREQWYDGANVFAVAPRKVISYDRNKFTNRALKEVGVEVIEVASSELSRGLGGPRCMTMPIERHGS